MKISYDNREKAAKGSKRRKRAVAKNKHISKNEQYSGKSPSVPVNANNSHAKDKKPVNNVASPSTPISQYSTPKTNRDIFFNLHSSVSGKSLNSTAESDIISLSGSKKRKRTSRRQALNNSSADVRSENVQCGGDVHSPLSTQLIECLSRAQAFNASLTPPDMALHRKPFVSPIDKLLLKNKSSTSVIVATSVPPKRQKLLRGRFKDTTETIPNAPLPINLQNSDKSNSPTPSPLTSQGEDSTDLENTDNYKNLGNRKNEIVEVGQKLPSDIERSSPNQSSSLIGVGVDNEKTSALPSSENELFLELDEAAAVTVSANTKSPSIVSTDSANGSSITNDSNWMTFSTGDLYWGQIYSYCFWPCMVCPDPQGKTISTERNVRHDDEYVVVHVRFFADNARRNWVRRENLMAYKGLDSYKLHVEDLTNKYGKKNAKYKLFMPPTRKKNVWIEAIREANMVSVAPQADRLEKFFDIFDKSKMNNQDGRKRRLSMLIHNDVTSDFGSQYDSTDNLSGRTLIAVKRERSVSPFSPAYSPIKPSMAKRVRLIAGAEKETSLATNRVDNANEKVFNSSLYKKFHTVIKDFVMEHNTNADLEHSVDMAVRNIWALKHLNQQQMNQRLLDTFDESALGSSVIQIGREERAVKRLSNRLKTIKMRTLVTPSIQEVHHSVQPSVPQTDEMHTDDKPKRLLNRPMEEVIEDIFRLESKYLFRSVRRMPLCKYCLEAGGNITRCTKSCHAWFHIECINKVVNNTKNRRSARGSKSAASEEISLPTEKERMSLPVPSVAQAFGIQTVNKSYQEPPRHITAENGMEIENAICRECASQVEPKCNVCDGKETTMEQLMFCHVPRCMKAYHASCCRYWPQAKITKLKNNMFRCPAHVCHTCVSDDPSGKFQLIAHPKLVKCVKCPASYHIDSTCIPAGSQILSTEHIICPRHSGAKPEAVNVCWCFICAGGDGTLLCCDTCPMAVHAECLNITLDPNEAYICEDCEAGRMPLYGEIVWAKFNSFRWWPSIILPPTEVPLNIFRKTHNPLEFVVRFFGTHDHGWISRRRVYLYNEADNTEHSRSKTYLNQSFIRGVEEAKKIFEMVSHKNQKNRLAIESKDKRYPQPYVRIRANRAVPPVKLQIDMNAVNKCNCDPNLEAPCGPYSNCLNRALQHECNKSMCPAGDRCQNQMFRTKASPRLEVVYTKDRGFGLVCREPINDGSFIIEYVGEVINEAEYKQRVAQKKADREGNFYFLSFEKGYYIDAGPKGNVARFMNHSCEPNCQSLKWSVNGVTRVGLFAMKDIPTDTELTFNYNWEELLGVGTNVCHCGAVKCAGQIGRKYKEDKLTKIVEETVANTTKIKRKRAVKPRKKKIAASRKSETKVEIRLPQSSMTTFKKKRTTPSKGTLAANTLPGTTPGGSNIDQ